MSPFRKRDRLEHPVYGIGEIQKVTKISDSLSILDVYFPQSDTRKKLNAQWAAQCCKRISVVPENPGYTLFQDGTYVKDPDLSDDVWQVFSEQNTVWTEELRNGLQYLMRSIVPGINFVLIGPYTAVLLAHSEGTTDKQIEKAARKYMTAIFRSHPDFTCLESDDDRLVITMQDYHVCLYIPAETVAQSTISDMAFRLNERTRLMEYCAEKRLYAIVRSAPTE
jgi:hypothetical protein